MSGERSDTAKGDRLRVKEFQNFWYKVQENLVMLRHTASDGRAADKAPVAATNQEILKDMYLFDPSHPHKIMWDVVIGIFILWSVFVVPFKIGFQAKSHEWEAYFDMVLVVLFALDILVNFNSAFVDPIAEKLVTDRSEISSNYMKFWFWVDSVSTIPFELVTSSVSTSSLRLVKVLRLFRLMKLVRIIKFSKFANRLNELDMNPSALKLLTLMIQIMFIAHLISCAWFYTTISLHEGMIEAELPIEELPTTWATEAGVVYADDFDKYVYSFYWTITTMLSIGYGDIIPTNMRERMYAMCVMMVGGALFGAVIAQVTKFIENRNPQAKEFKNNMDELKAYLREGKSLDETNPQLRKEIVRAYGYYLTRKSSFVESGMFIGLPKENLIELVFAIFDKEVRQVPGLVDFSNRHAISYLLLHMQPFNASLGEVIFKQYDVAEEMVLVATGSVLLTVESGSGARRKKLIIGVADDGDYFGELEYLKNSCRMTSFSAEINSSLLSINYNHLDKLEEDHTEAYDKFMETVEFRYEAFVRARNVDRSQPPLPGGEHPLWVNGKFQENDNAMNLKRAQLRDSFDKYLIVVGELDSGKPITDEATAKDFVELKIIHPNFRWKLAWDIFIGVLLIWTVVIAPVQIAFLAVQNIYIELFFAAVFFVDMCFNFRTAYFSDLADAFVVNPKDIAVHYTQTWLFCDVISTIPFDIVLALFIESAGNGLGATKLFKSARLLRIMKLVRVSKIRQYLIQLEESMGISPAVFNIIQMYIGVFFIAHIIACLWWGLSTSIGGEHAWYDDVIITGSLRHADVSEQYFTSLYWTFTTLSTTGYGDITPANTSEMVLCVFVMMIGASVFGYIVANVSALMNQMDAKSSIVAEKLTETTEYLAEKNCPKQIMDKTLKHVKNVLNQRSTYDEEGILARLPTRLRNELLMVQRQNVINAIPIFEFLKGNSSMAMYIFNLLDPIYFQNGQVIFREGDIAHDVFFITAGAVRSYRKKATKVQKTTASTRPPITSPSTSFNPTGGSAFAAESYQGTTKLSERRHVYMHNDETHHRFHPGDDHEYLGELPAGCFIGHMALLQNKKQTATAVAVSEKNCSMYALSRADIGRTTRESAHVSMYLQEALAKAIRKQQDDVGRKLVKTRRANALRTYQKDRYEEVKALAVAKEKENVERESQQRRAKVQALASNLSNGASKFKHRMSLANLGAAAMFGNKGKILHRSTIDSSGLAMHHQPASVVSAPELHEEPAAHASGFSIAQFNKLAAIADAAESNPHSCSSSSAGGSPREPPASHSLGAIVRVSVSSQDKHDSAAESKSGESVSAEDRNSTDEKSREELAEESPISQEVREKRKADANKPGAAVSLAALLPGPGGASVGPTVPPSTVAVMKTDDSASPKNENSASFGRTNSAKADKMLGRDMLVKLSNPAGHVRGFDLFKQMSVSVDAAFEERRSKHLIKLKRFPSCPEFSHLTTKVSWCDAGDTVSVLALEHAGSIYETHDHQRDDSESEDDAISITRPLRNNNGSVTMDEISHGASHTAGHDYLGLKEAIAFAKATGASTAAAAIKTLNATRGVLSSPQSGVNSPDASCSEHINGAESPVPGRNSALSSRRISASRRERENSIKEDCVSDLGMGMGMGMGLGKFDGGGGVPVSLAKSKRGRSMRRLQRDLSNSRSEADSSNSTFQVLLPSPSADQHDSAPSMTPGSGGSVGSIESGSLRHRASSPEVIMTSFANSALIMAQKTSSGVSKPILPPITVAAPPVLDVSGDGSAGVLKSAPAKKLPSTAGNKIVRSRRFSWPSLRADIVGDVIVDSLEHSHPLV